MTGTTEPQPISAASAAAPHCTVARYRVRPEAVADNERLVRAVYRELHELQPAGFAYATYRLDDGQTFVHVAVRDGEGSNVLPQLATFQAFQAELSTRCESAPDVRPAQQIGAFTSR